MSQIVNCFAVPESALSEVQRHLIAGDWKGFWQSLWPFEIENDFPYSGYVVAVLAEYLRTSGIELPVSRDPAVQQLVERCAPLACASRPDTTAAATMLAGVSASEAVLASYWHDFTGEEDAEAGAMMAAALDWLRKAFAAAQQSDWCIILEG